MTWHLFPSFCLGSSPELKLQSMPITQEQLPIAGPPRVGPDRCQERPAKERGAVAGVKGWGGDNRVGTKRLLSPYLAYYPLFLRTTGIVQIPTKSPGYPDMMSLAVAR